jgi:hypothetical protein
LSEYVCTETMMIVGLLFWLHVCCHFVKVAQIFVNWLNIKDHLKNLFTRKMKVKIGLFQNKIYFSLTLNVHIFSIESKVVIVLIKHIPIQCMFMKVHYQMLWVPSPSVWYFYYLGRAIEKGSLSILPSWIWHMNVK